MAGFLCFVSGGIASAQDSTLDSEYIRRIQAAQTLPAHGETPFGEQVNAYTGDLPFVQQEFELPGTGPTIGLVRSYNSGQWRDSSEEHTSELPSLMRNYSAVFSLQTKQYNHPLHP